MPMLKRKMLLKALIHELPKLVHIGRKSDKTITKPLIDELAKLYGQLGLYDHIIDKIKLGGIL